MSEKSTLYICYFGMREPLVQTQVLPYLRELTKLDGLKVSILTFEPELQTKWTAEEIETEQKRLAAEGIIWHFLGYHKRFSVLATAYDIFAGALFVRNILRREDTGILHCRVHVPALMGAIGRKLSPKKPKLIFDIRGFMPEEYTDAGIWPEGGWLYKAAKRIERWLLREADGFVVLTEKAREILFAGSEGTGYDEQGRPVEVIPCCVDLSRFSGLDEAYRNKRREELGVSDRPVLAYVGSFGGWYLTDETIGIFKAARERDPKTFALILTQSSEAIADKLRDAGYADEDMLITKVAPADVPKFLVAADTAVSFIKTCYSKQSSSPTKVAEYLACGLPIIANRGIGDIDHLIEYNKLGVMIDDLSPEGFSEALAKVDDLGKISERCQAAARDLFDLSIVGGEKYRRLYTRLMAEDDAA